MTYFDEGLTPQIACSTRRDVVVNDVGTPATPAYALHAFYCSLCAALFCSIREAPTTYGFLVSTRIMGKQLPTE